MWRYVDIIPEYQIENNFSITHKVLNIVGGLMENQKLKDFTLKQDLVPLTNAEICEEMQKYVKRDAIGMYCYLGRIIGFIEMEEILKKFKKLVIEIEPLTHQHEDKGE